MIGKTISHYKILEKLGEGGMGIVYKAEDTKLKRTVALKFLPTHLTADHEARERFEREAQAAAALNHPNIITIYEIGEYEGQIYTAMQYVEGESLAEKLSISANSNSFIPIDEILGIAIQICEGLKRAHEAGIIHRDIKPANILTDRDDLVKILDFGLAKLKGITKLTKEPSTLGTVHYMSPEQALGEEVDHQTDIWSLGVVLYEMLTGQLPFNGDYEHVVVYLIINGAIESITGLRAGVPVRLERIVNKALEKEKENRYHIIDEILFDLKQLVKELETDIRLPSEVMEKGSTKRELNREGEKDYHKINFLKYMGLLLFLKRVVIPLGIIVIMVVGFFLSKPLLFDKVLVSEPISIAVVSFENKTRDKTYDYLQAAIPNLLITSLEQSRNLRVTTWERLYDLLKQTGKEDVEIIDKDLGFELCRMDGIDAIVLGSFVKTGNVFTLDLKVLDVETERLLKSAGSNGEGVTSILKRQIDELSREISRGVGISDRKIEATQLPIADVTTTSIDAYNYFLRGREDWEKYYIDDARLFFEKAVHLDSTFAVAYLYLASVYAALGNTKEMSDAYKKAKNFAPKATGKERLYIEADYANIIEGDPEKSLSILKQIAKNYNKEKRIHFNIGFHFMSNNLFSEAIEKYNEALDLDPNYGEAINGLAYTYAVMEDFSKSIEYLKRYASASPGDANPFDSMAETYFRMGKLKDAIAKYKEALEVRPNFYYTYWSIGYIFALKEDYSKAMEYIDQSIAMAPSSGIRAEGYVLRGFYNYWLGNLNQSLSDLQKASELAEKVGNELWKAYVEWIKGWIHYDKGELESTQKHFKNWYDFIIVYPLPDKPSQSIAFYKSDFIFYLGLVNVKEGLFNSAKSRLVEMKSLMDKIDPAVKDRITYYYNSLWGELLLSEGFVQKAIAVCETELTIGIPPYMRSRYILLYNVPFPSDVLARAYREKGKLNKAIAEYERLITFDPNSKDRRLIYPKYHYRLAKLYEEKGWITKAIKQYEKFLEIWKNADKDLPELIDAKARLALLLEKV